jgi:hypothetical protein
MTAPFVFITTHRIKPGREAQFAALHEDYLGFVERNEPRLLGHFTYSSDDGSEVSLVQVHPDGESADHHLQVVAPRLAEVADVVEASAIEVYGEPGPGVRAALDRNRDAGVSVRVTSRVVGGFARR